MGSVLHVLRRALHVHQDIGNTQPDHGGKHLRVQLAPRNIVDDGRAILLHAHPRHVRPEGIDGHHGPRRHPADDTQAEAQAFTFFFGRDIGRPRS